MMKAESAIFKNIQFPMTVIGISPKLLILAVVLGVVIFIALFLMDLIEVALIAAIVFIVISWFVIFRKTQKNAHFASFIFNVSRFWRSRSHLTLISGQSSLKIKGGQS